MSHSNEDYSKTGWQQWVFGMISEESGEAKIFLIPDRKAITLEPLIQNNCNAGSIIHSDGWMAYSTMKWDEMDIEHRCHVH